LLATLARVLALLLIVAVTVLLASLMAALSALLVLLIVLAHGFLAPLRNDLRSEPTLLTRSTFRYVK
jgi:uncharacterized membrane protein